jgi:GT2 family glycosyltransferase
VPGDREQVRVVVVNYLGDALTLRCLDSLATTEWPADRWELIVVDNGSQEGFAAEVARRWPEARLLSPGRNTGFAGGVNLGIRAPGRYDVVALLNNDAVVTPGWLAPLVDGLRTDERVAAVSPKVLFEGVARPVRIEVPGAPAPAPPSHRRHGVRLDALVAPCEVRLDEGFFVEASADGEARWCDAAGTMFVRVDEIANTSASVGLVLWTPQGRRVRIVPGDGPPVEVDVDGPTDVELEVTGRGWGVVNNAGSRLVEGGFSADRGLYELDDGRFDEAADVTFFYGGAVALRQAFLADVGDFDERLFLYYEDTDLSWRGLLRGWRFRYEPSSVVHHRHAASSGTDSEVFRFHNERNRLLVLLKCAPVRVAARAYAVACKQLVVAALDAAPPRRRVTWREVRLRARVVGSAMAKSPAMCVARRRLRATVGFSEVMQRAEPR